MERQIRSEEYNKHMLTYLGDVLSTWRLVLSGNLKATRLKFGRILKRGIARNLRNFLRNFLVKIHRSRLGITPNLYFLQGKAWEVVHISNQQNLLLSEIMGFRVYGSCISYLFLFVYILILCNFMGGYDLLVVLGEDFYPG